MAEEIGSKCRRTEERTGDEPKATAAAATPDSLDAGTERVQRWTLPMPASNEPRRPKACFLVLGFG